ncbi:hypothetical protein GG344DRAFT_74563 [Lentinula edodes]|nr:hypothetical protein GG344DRAFT_74563 [Lentinula edodes]
MGCATFTDLVIGPPSTNRPQYKTAVPTHMNLITYPLPSRVVNDCLELVALILENVFENVKNGSGRNYRKDLRTAVSVCRIWRTAGIKYLFRIMVIGSQQQILNLYHWTSICENQHPSMVLIYNLRESNFRRLGEKAVWWRDSLSLLLLGKLDLSSTEEVRICGGYPDSEDSEHGGLEPLFCLWKKMPKLRLVDCTFSDFSISSASSFLLGMDRCKKLTEIRFRKWSVHNFLPSDAKQFPPRTCIERLECEGSQLEYIGEKEAINTNSVKHIVLTVAGTTDIEGIEAGMGFFLYLETIEIRMLANDGYPNIDPPSSLTELIVTVFTKTWACFTGLHYLLELLKGPESWDGLVILHLKMTPMHSYAVTKELQDCQMWEVLGEVLKDVHRFPQLFTIEIEILQDTRHVFPWSGQSPKDEKGILASAGVETRESETRMAISRGLQYLESTRDVNISITFEHCY